jgi:hypothetical protein
VQLEGARARWNPRADRVPVSGLGSAEKVFLIVPVLGQRHINCDSKVDINWSPSLEYYIELGFRGNVLLQIQSPAGRTGFKKLSSGSLSVVCINLLDPEAQEQRPAGNIWRMEKPPHLPLLFLTGSIARSFLFFPRTQRMHGLTTSSCHGSEQARCMQSQQCCLPAAQLILLVVVGAVLKWKLVVFVHYR